MIEQLGQTDILLFVSSTRTLRRTIARHGGCRKKLQSAG
jgi:hypothetical protein